MSQSDSLLSSGLSVFCLPFFSDRCAFGENEPDPFEFVRTKDLTQDLGQEYKTHMELIRRPRKYRAIFDMDAIKADFFGKLLPTYNRDYNANLSIADLTHYSLRDNVPVGHKTDEYFRTPGWYLDLKPLPGALEGTAELVAMTKDADPKKQIELLICSSPGRAFGCVPDKATWLDTYFPELYYRERVFTSAKYAVRGNAIIDDGPENIFHWKNENPDGAAITIAYPYNECVADMCALRAEGWQDTFKAWEQIVAFIKRDVEKFYG
jgi:5'(3')-deoxyribonucleotidase